MSFILSFLVGLSLFMNLIFIDAAQEESVQKKATQGYCCYDPNDRLIKLLQDHVLQDKQFELHFKYSLPLYKRVDFLAHSSVYFDEFKNYKSQHHVPQEDNTIETIRDFQKKFVYAETKKIAATRIQAAWRGNALRKKNSVSCDKKSLLIMKKAQLASKKLSIQKAIVDLEKLLFDVQQGCKKDNIYSFVVPKNMSYRLTDGEEGEGEFVSMPAFYSIGDRKNFSISFHPKELLQEYFCSFYDYKSQEQKQLQRDFFSSVATRTIRASFATVLQARWRGNKDRCTLAAEGEDAFSFVNKMQQISKNRETAKVVAGYEKNIEDLKKCLNQLDAQKRKITHVINLPDNLKNTKSNKCGSVLHCHTASASPVTAGLSSRVYDMKFIEALEEAIEKNGVVEIEDNERLKADTFICCPGCVLAAYKKQENVLPVREFLVKFALGEFVKTRHEDKSACKKYDF